MAEMLGANFERSTTAVSEKMPMNPTARPNIAVPTGRTVGTSVRKSR